ncbi:thiamine transporter membrane protein [Hafnia alvei]|uniref:Thiamine transporter membrane protein n=1 Tax=Hafnia alvei TaxID=569 RepID=A0A377PN84_HAFAL|nr:thiamine transporter membrane protein [Hafnia alvei]
MALSTPPNSAAGALIFMLCFASFATVLSLGGGPQATTIELAIYQALSYDYDLSRAALLAILQLLCCLGLVLLSQKLSGILPVGHTRALKWRNPVDTLAARLLDSCVIFCALLLILPPAARGDSRRRESCVCQRTDSTRAMAGNIYIAQNCVRRRPAGRNADDDVAMEQP